MSLRMKKKDWSRTLQHCYILFLFMFLVDKLYCYFIHSRVDVQSHDPSLGTCKGKWGLLDSPSSRHQYAHQYVSERITSPSPEALQTPQTGIPDSITTEMLVSHCGLFRLFGWWSSLSSATNQTNAASWRRARYDAPYDSSDYLSSEEDDGNHSKLTLRRMMNQEHPALRLLQFRIYTIIIIITSTVSSLFMAGGIPLLVAKQFYFSHLQ